MKPNREKTPQSPWMDTGPIGSTEQADKSNEVPQAAKSLTVWIVAFVGVPIGLASAELTKRGWFPGHLLFEIVTAVFIATISVVFARVCRHFSWAHSAKVARFSDSALIIAIGTAFFGAIVWALLTL